MSVISSIVSGFVASVVPQSDAIIVTASQLAQREAQAVQVKDSAFMDSDIPPVDNSKDEFPSVDNSKHEFMPLEVVNGGIKIETRNDEYKGDKIEAGYQYRTQLECCGSADQGDQCSKGHYIYFNKRENSDHISEFKCPPECRSKNTGAQDIVLKLQWVDEIVEEGVKERLDKVQISSGGESHPVEFNAEAAHFLSTVDITSMQKIEHTQDTSGISFTATPLGEGERVARLTANVDGSWTFDVSIPSTQ